ncbi:uncharacterized protein LOC105843176 [Hydra vulgaris]|uniref:Uncharacterized protein LOC105843176 n=1 Tax=Hydra vulgaris TaxID=6087 RepID=A0ABM4BTB4_HYDVU
MTTKILWFFSLLLICSFVFVTGQKYKTFYYRKDSSIGHGVCRGGNYNGGKINVEIKEIGNPTAVLEESFFESFFDLGKKTSESGKYLSEETQSLIENVKNEAAKRIMNNKKVLNNLSKISKCLGVFGFAFGILNDMTTPSPQDIIDATNKAIVKLRNEVNDKLKDMKDYIDNTVLKIKADLLENQYLYFEKNLEFCAGLYPAEKSNDQILCTRELFKSIVSRSNSFRPKISKKNSWNDTKKPSINEVKEIEAGFHLHRMYCTLYLKVGGILFQTYEKDESNEGRFYYNFYASHLKKGADDCKNYTEFGYNWIEDIHVKRPNCKDTFKCEDSVKIEEGLLGTHTADSIRCSCVFDGTQKSTDACYHNMIIRADDDEPEDWSRWEIRDNGVGSELTTKDAAEIIGKKILIREAGEYLEKEEKNIYQYWYINGLNQIHIWESISQKFDDIIRQQETVVTLPVKISKKDRKRIKELFKQAQTHIATAFSKTSTNANEKNKTSKKQA